MDADYRALAVTLARETWPVETHGCHPADWSREAAVVTWCGRVVPPNQLDAFPTCTDCQRQQACFEDWCSWAV